MSALPGCCRQAGEDFEGPCPSWGLVPARDFARDHSGPELSFGPIIGGVDSVMLQELKEVVLLFAQPRLLLMT